MNEKLLANLEGNITILRDFIGRMPEDAVLKRRRPDVWTIYEHLEHVSGAQVMLLHRIEMFMNEEKPVITPYIPPDKPAENASKPVEHLLDTFTKYRMKQLDAIKKAPDPLWEKRALHPEYSDYSFITLVRHAYLHDSFHMYRMEELWLQKDGFLKTL